MPARTLFVSEALRDLPVEGGQVLAGQLAQHVSATHGAAVVRPLGPAEGWRRRLARFVPLIAYWRWTARVRHVIYLPDSGITVPAVVRAFALWLLLGCPLLDVVVIAQPQTIPAWALRIFPRRWTFVTTERDQLATARDNGRDVRDLTPRVDPGRVADPALTSAVARERLGIPAGERVYLHVGHPTRGRNLRAMQPLTESGVVVLVLSPYREIEAGALPEGERVIVVHRRVSDIGAYYRAADVYVFPTFLPNEVIGLPMSIVEALANGTPVVARASAATARWEDDPAVTLVSSDAELVAAARELRPDPQRADPQADPSGSACLGDLTVCRAATAA